MAVVRSFLFGSDVLVQVVCQDAKGIVVIPERRMCTPCGTLDFPAGAEVFFSKAEVDEFAIVPQSGTEIRLADA